MGIENVVVGRVECPECVRDFQHIFRLFVSARRSRSLQLVRGPCFGLRNEHELQVINK